jgi:outer membrane protein OmpA-like peptidoglycan-associated protein
MRIRALSLLAVAALVAACATPRNDLIVVLPEEGGKVGAVVVNDGKRETVLNTAYASARGGGEGGMQAGSSNESEVRQVFSAAREALPPKPISFTLYFIEGKDEFTPESKQVVEKLFAEIAKRPAPEISVIGHTDSVGGDAFNDALSLQRAEKVRSMLIDLGIAAQSVQASGRGRRDLLVPTAANISEPINRRVEISVR